MHIRFTPLRIALAAAILALGSHAQAQNAPIKVGLMLPATGTYANLGTMIENASAGAAKLKPKEFEDSLSQIGGALNNFDKFDEGFNTIFAVFDNLVNQNMPSGEARASSLKLTSQAGAQQASLMFIAQPKLKEPAPEAANV
jgi:hypothetical protein